MNASGVRHVPDGAPTSFVPARWRPYLERARAAGEENLHKHYWELCVLFALQGALRSGEIWVEGSRRYANPASYLIPVEDWPAQREAALALTGMPGTFAERLEEIDATSRATSTISRCCSPTPGSGAPRRARRAAPQPARG